MKRYIRKIIVIAIWIPVYFPVSAQYVNDHKRSADQFYAKGDYYSAAQYYEKSLDNKGTGVAKYEPYQVQKQGSKKSKMKDNRPESLYRLGESYRHLNDHTHAGQWYAALLQEEGAGTYPLARYYYAVSLRATNKYAESQQQLEQFIREYSKEDIYLQQAKRELSNLKFIQQELAKSVKDIHTGKLGSEGEGADYAAVLLGSNKIVYTSTGTEKRNALYSANLQDNTLSGVEKIGLAVPDKAQDGAAAFTPDGNKIFFTRWLQDDKTKTLAIYSSEKTGNGWSDPVALNAEINVPGTESKQPYVTADGKYLLFASNRAGGIGGFDIWYAVLDTKLVPGKAILISSINTNEDEEVPYYDAASKTLVFSSKGRTGMGGFDLFAANGAPGANFSEPVNLGYPVNSVKDDIYFTTKTDHLLEDALISSDREALCCLELFSIQKEEPKVDVVIEPVPVPKTEDPFKGKKTLVTQDIYFAFNKMAITSDSYSYLDEMASYLKENPSIKVEISAHTDGIGSKEYNLKLSQGRADAVADYIIKAGVAADRIVAAGKGECCPLEKETIKGKDDPEARQKNRRVEFRILE